MKDFSFLITLNQPFAILAIRFLIALLSGWLFVRFYKTDKSLISKFIIANIISSIFAYVLLTSNILESIESIGVTNGGFGRTLATVLIPLSYPVLIILIESYSMYFLNKRQLSLGKVVYISIFNTIVFMAVWGILPILMETYTYPAPSPSKLPNVTLPKLP